MTSPEVIKLSWFYMKIRNSPFDYIEIIINKVYVLYPYYFTKILLFKVDMSHFN